MLASVRFCSVFLDNHPGQYKIDLIEMKSVAGCREVVRGVEARIPGRVKDCSSGVCSCVGSKGEKP